MKREVDGVFFGRWFGFTIYRQVRLRCEKVITHHFIQIHSHRVTAIEKGLTCVESKQEKLGTVSQDRKLNVVLIICWCVFSNGI